MRRISLALAVLVSIGVSACSSSPEGDGPLGAAPQAQIPPGLEVQMTFADGTALATVFTVSQAVGNYTPDHEYWYVNTGALGELGSSNLTITSTTLTGSPSDPGYSSEQKFVLTENVSWGTGWTTDPRSGGNLYAGTDANGDSLALRMYTNSGGTKVTGIVWYQILSSGSPANITPSGTFSTATGSVSVPSGDLGYDIAQNTSG
jgi:hypothetical protein